MNFPLQKLCILTIWFKIFLYFAFWSLHHACMILAAFSLYLGFIIFWPLFFGLKFLILNLAFFLAFSWAKSTTPPFSHRCHLNIGLSMSLFEPFCPFAFAVNIAKDTNKNLLCFPFNVVFLFPIDVLFKVFLSKDLPSPKLRFKVLIS